MSGPAEGTRPPRAAPRGNPRSANGHRRRELRAWLAARGEPCHICGQPIDYSLDWWVDPKDGRRKRHPMSFEADEVVPVSLGGDPLDRANVLPAHRICNERRGNATRRRDGSTFAPRATLGQQPTPQPVRPTRDW